MELVPIACLYETLPDGQCMYDLLGTAIRDTQVCECPRCSRQRLRIAAKTTPRYQMDSITDMTFDNWIRGLGNG